MVAPPPPLAAPAQAAYGVAATDPLTAPLLDFLPPAPSAAARSAETGPTAPGPAAAAPSWPCGRCEAVNPMSESVCAGCGGGFLAEVAQAGKPLLVLPVVGDLGAMSRGRRAWLAVGLVAALVAPLALLTLVLTQRPESDPGVGTVTSVTSTSP